MTKGASQKKTSSSTSSPPSPSKSGYPIYSRVVPFWPVFPMVINQLVLFSLVFVFVTYKLFFSELKYREENPSLADVYYNIVDHTEFLTHAVKDPYRAVFGPDEDEILSDMDSDEGGEEENSRNLSEKEDDDEGEEKGTERLVQILSSIIGDGPLAEQLQSQDIISSSRKRWDLHRLTNIDHWFDGDNIETLQEELKVIILDENFLNLVDGATKLSMRFILILGVIDESHSQDEAIEALPDLLAKYQAQISDTEGSSRSS